MSAVSIAAVASMILSCISIVSVIYMTAYRFGKLEVKVDTMWDFQMRRSFAEAVRTGVGTMNSPLQLSPSAKATLDPLKEDLQKFWDDHRDKTNIDFIMLLESRFGDELLKRVCIPLGLSHGACLLIALAVAKDTDTICLDDIKSGLVYH